jgi:DNA replication and repair protein RecF
MRCDAYAHLMQFNYLELKNFRNYKNLRIEIPSGISIFVGSNGQGKTNLLEAMYLLLRGESFRPATKINFLSEPSGAFIHARLKQDYLNFDLSAQITEDRAVYSINDKKVRPSILARKFPVVLFSPECLSAIKEGPDQRRQLLDDIVLMHSRARDRVLYDYRRCLRTRNRILRDFKNGLSSEEKANALLNSLDPLFLPLAAELTVARLDALKAMSEDVQRAARAVLSPMSVDISVEYLISGQNSLEWSRSEVISAMHNRSIELRRQEMQSGSSLVGPHRHDIRFLFAGKDSRFFCSQGQQRALILSFKMAQILYHHRAYQTYPFLLLDDVLSELDPERRANLINFLKDIPSQIFLTTTDLAFSMDFGNRKPNVFSIERGFVERQ